MTTDVYESAAVPPGREPRYLEIKQRMKDAPLTFHPETGEPIRRVVLGGFGILKSGESSTPGPASRSGRCCAPGECCH